MSCFKLDPPQLPPISGGLTVPLPTIPAFSGGIDLCCQINVLLFIDLPSSISIPIPGPVLEAIDADIATVDAYLSALDLISFDCPLD